MIVLFRGWGDLLWWWGGGHQSQQVEALAQLASGWAASAGVFAASMNLLHEGVLLKFLRQGACRDPRDA